MIEPIVKVCAGLDVHKAIVVSTILQEDEDESLTKETRQHKTYREELQALAEWLAQSNVELAVMESTGVYWKSVYEALEAKGIRTYVVNARDIKKAPGRKTDVLDSEWLAEVGRCGLVSPSFIPPKDFRELRLVTRYRRKLKGMLAGEKNRLHKILDDAGIRLGCVVSDIDGVSARKMIDALIAGEQTEEVMAEAAKGRLRSKKDELKQALVGNLSDRHRFLLKRIRGHMQWLEAQIAEIDVQVVAAMKLYEPEWQLIQTIPGIDEIGAAMLLIEIGTDMSRFGSKERLSSWAGLCPGNNESAGKKKRAKPGKGMCMSEACFANAQTAQ